MTSKIFIAKNNLTIDANFSPNIIFVRSSIGNVYFAINTNITINITDSVNVDKIFIVKCFTDATIITPSWTTNLQNGSCIAFTRLNILSAQPIRAGESCAVISMLNQSIAVNGSAIIDSIVDSASEIGIPNSSMVVQPSNCFVYYSTTGGLMFVQTFIYRNSLTATNSAIELLSYPMLPGIDGNAEEAALIPVLSQNSQTYLGVPFLCSASSELSGTTAAYRGFNSYGTWYTANTTTGWLQIRLPFSVVVDKFEITTAVQSPPSEKFTRWEILGSNDGLTFKRLFYSDLPVPFTKRTRFYFTDNIAPYMYYRFNGLEGTGTKCGISDLQYYSKATPQLRFVETSSSMKNDNYTVNRNLVIDMPANTPVYFWFTPQSWPAGNFSGYCVIKK